MTESNVTLIAETGTSKDKQDDRGLPWLVGDPAPAAGHVVGDLLELVELLNKA